MAVRHSHDNLARYEALKSATCCRGQSTPIITTLGYTDASSFFECPVAHCLAFGLHRQLFKDTRDIIGPDQFNRAYKKAEKRCAYILRPSILKRFVKRIPPYIIKPKPFKQIQGRGSLTFNDVLPRLSAS